MTTLLAKRILGAAFLIIAAAQYVSVALNDHPRRLGGHDLRPLLLPALLLTIAGFGLVIDARWAKITSSLLLAAWGVWLAVRDTFVLRLPDPLVSILFGIIMCLPCLFTFSNRSTTVPA